jgi:hypothetical protein
MSAIKLADYVPDSNEARAARRMIEAVRSAHPDTAPAPGAGAPAPRPQGNGS